MATSVRRGPLVWSAVTLLRYEAGLRPGITTLIGAGSFVAGRLSVSLPDWANAALVLAAGALLPIIYLYSLPNDRLAILIARILLRRAREGLASVARSNSEEHLNAYVARHYPHWIAPGVVTALRSEARASKTRQIP
jgi:hypothetical protein